ncbi:hypothetical protein D3C78_1268400 [compost metagenome]
MTHQGLQQGELLAGEGDLLIPHGDLVAAGIQAQAALGEVTAFAAADPGTLAQQHPDAGHHLPYAERLAHVVVGPGIQQPHLLLLRIPCRQHQHRVGVVFADGLQDLDAVPVRQAEIQDHQIGVEVAVLRQPFVDAHRLAHLVPLGDQADPQKAANGRFIIYDQDMGHLASRGECWGAGDG